jgi:hypothetical protein
LRVGISHSKSVVTVQRAFRAMHAKDPPTDKIIRVWYKQFTETGCLGKQKSSVHPLTAEDYLNIISMCVVSPVVHTSNISSCQKNFFSFPVAVNSSIKVGPLVFLL